MPTPDTILTAVQSAFRVTREELVGPRRLQNLAEARITAACLMLTMADESEYDVNRTFNRTRHWASFTAKRCPDLAAVDRHYKRKLDTVRNQLQECLKVPNHPV